MKFALVPAKFSRPTVPVGFQFSRNRIAGVVRALPMLAVFLPPPLRRHISRVSLRAHTTLYTTLVSPRLLPLSPAWSLPLSHQPG